MTRLVPVLALSLVSHILSGCMAGDPDPDAKPSGKLYQCLGTPPYDENSWEETERLASAELAAHPENCRPPSEFALTLFASLDYDSARAVNPGDSIRLRSVVLNAGCGFLLEENTTVAAGPGPTGFVPIWDGRDAQERPAPTGEYYVNVEATWSDGHKDTSWNKVGFINLTCAP